MKTASLKLKKGITKAAVAASGNELNRRLLNGLLTAILGLAMLYIVFLGQMVVNILERKSLDSEARTLVNEVSELEVAYLSASGKIDMEFSHSLGFKDASPEYASRKSLGRVGISANEI